MTKSLLLTFKLESSSSLFGDLRTLERIDGLLLWCVTSSAVTGDPWQLLWDQSVLRLSGGVKQAPAGNLALGLLLCVCVVDLSPTRLCTFFTRPERWSNRKSSSTGAGEPADPHCPARLPEAGQAAPALSVPSSSAGRTRRAFQVHKEL